MGSVKDLVVLREPSVGEAGVGRFIFSDRYSVFDWGEMPNHIADKGKAICVTTAYFFEKLEKLGVGTHYLGCVEDGETKRLEKLESATNIMEFRLLRVLKPRAVGNSYDYSIYREERKNFLIPLEVIYRNALPEGSSIFKRLEEGSLKPGDIGLDQPPVPGQILESPIFDVSTKLESVDRYITWEEAKKICGLSQEEIEEIRETTLFVNRLISGEVEKLGLFNEDGKVEFGFDEDRRLILVDALGTLDECRFTYKGFSVSKEIARIYYRGTEWCKEVEKAKKRDRINWRKLVGVSPPPLPGELADSISLIYKAYANQVTGRKWFEAPPLTKVLDRVKGLLG